MAKFTKIKYHTFVITKTIATYFVYYCGEEEKQREIQQTINRNILPINN
jgi:hypothetical protein